jgi:hypothetical protein
MSITIEKNIPLPARNMRGPSDKYAILRDMEVGDSIVVDVKPAAIATHYRAVANELNRKFVSRPEGEGARVWRKA